MKRFWFWVKLVHYHIVLAYVVAGLLCVISWVWQDEIPSSGPLQVACITVLAFWLLNGWPHFTAPDRRMVAITAPLRVLFLFGMASIADPNNKEGYMLALAFFSLLTTYDIVRGRVFN